MFHKPTQLQGLRLLEDALGLPLTKCPFAICLKLVKALGKICPVKSRPRTRDACIEKLCAHIDLIRANRQMLRKMIGLSEIHGADEGLVDQDPDDNLYTFFDGRNFTLVSLDYFR